MIRYWSFRPSVNLGMAEQDARRALHIPCRMLLGIARDFESIEIE
jgi:hypothetical protein